METLRYIEKKNNLIKTAKPKMQTWRAHVMRYYDTFKLAPNIHPTFHHYAKYVKCPFQRWCCSSAALNIAANLETAAVTTGLEKVNDHSNPKERQCQRMLKIRSDQIRLVAQSCPTLCNPMNRSTPGLPVHHQLQEFTQTHVHRVSDAIKPSHPLSSPSPLAPNPSQHQSLFQWVNSSHEVARVLEVQL